MNKPVTFYTFEEVFEKACKSAKFRMAYHKEILRIVSRCTKCKGKFLQHHHIHITRKGIFHTGCYNKTK